MQIRGTEPTRLALKQNLISSATMLSADTTVLGVCWLEGLWQSSTGPKVDTYKGKFGLHYGRILHSSQSYDHQRGLQFINSNLLSVLDVELASEYQSVQLF